MILVFPDADTFRLALTGGFVPPDVTLAPAAVSFEPDGRLFLETDAKLGKKPTEELKRLGVTGAKRHHADPLAVTCWPQVVPAERDPAPPQLSSQAPVLFELPSAADLAEFVTEMLRLGNDRQSFRWVAVEGEPTPRVLLRVIGPPYYTLLRALDHPSAAGVHAYVEQAPRVWVEVGYSHPLAAQVKVADGQLLLVRPPRDWRFVTDAPFRDVYEALQFTLPSAPVEWADAPVESKLVVPLRLVPGNAADAAEMWVLHGPAADQLDTFVRDADDRVTQRLKFAVGTGPAGEQVIVLRTTPSKLAPPVLPFADAVGYKPFWKIPNLYVPAGTRLHPQLRRDVVRKLLADDADQLVWLTPGPAGAFTPETIPEDSFRPLEDWVDYVIESNHAPLAAWVEATQFGFEHFICSENQPPKPKDDKGPPKGRKGGKPGADDIPVATPVPTAKPAKAGDANTPALDFTPEAAEVKPPSAWLIRRQELEEQFLAVEGPLDSPERQALWPDLATANAGVGGAMDDAGLCWANALWEAPTPPAAWLDRWLRSEFPDLPRPVPAAALDQRMTPTDPTPGEARQFAAVLLAVAYQDPPPKWLTARLAEVQRYLEAHESKLPVRTAWLAAYRLAQLGGADILGLARVRDRLLQRLLEEGLNPERNLPTFLRFSGSKDAARVRLVRDKATELHRLVRAWAEKGTKASTALSQSDNGATLGYIDLLFAFAQAKLGEATRANEWIKFAAKTLAAGKSDDERGIAAGYLLKAYSFRVDQARAGIPAAGPLPVALTDELDGLHARASGQVNTPSGKAVYAINRLRQQSRILEPQERTDPYQPFTASHQGDVAKALLEIPGIRDPQVLARKIRDAYKTAKSAPTGSVTPFTVLLTALPFAARAGEAFTVEMLKLVPETLVTNRNPVTAPTAKDQGLLLERALILAGHFDRRELIGPLVDQFVGLVRAKTGDQRYDLVNVVAGQCVRSLRRLGLRDEIDRLLRRLQNELLGGQTVAQFRTRTAGKPDWAKALQSLLNLAGGWLTYGLTAQATPILDDARSELLSPEPSKLAPKDFTPLVQAYIAAVGQGPAETGLPQIVELFQRIVPERVTNGWTTAPCYSRFHLNIAEEVVFALTSDDFALGPGGRRWLEEDEYLIRRRVHRDMKRHLATSGL